MLYEDNSAKLLGLEEVIIKKVWEEETEKHIEIELPRCLHVCPDCGAETGKIHDYRMQSVKDIASFACVEKKFFVKVGNIFPKPASKAHQTKSKGEYTMDDLRFDPSALLIVGMLIGVVCTLL